MIRHKRYSPCFLEDLTSLLAGRFGFLTVLLAGRKEGTRASPELLSAKRKFAGVRGKLIKVEAKLLGATPIFL